MTMMQLNKAVKPIADRVKMIVARGVLKNVTDSTGVQKVQASLLAGELKDGIERFQTYGLSSNPPAGTEGIFLFIGGNRDHGVCVATDDKGSRFKNVASGEVALYDNKGNFIHLKTDGTIEITATQKIRMITPRLEVTGDIIDNCDTNTKTVKNARDTYNIHTHDGVQPGAGNTGDPNQQLT